MKGFLDLLRTTLIGGVLVVLPVALLGGVVAQALDSIIALVSPLTDLLPVHELGGVGLATIVAIGLILGFFFLAGLLARTTLGGRAWRGLEGAVLERVPGYKMTRTLSRQFAGEGGEDASMFAPAALLIPPDTQQLVYVIEEHGNGFSTIMIPSVPAAMAGPLQYVRSDRLRRLDASLATVVQSLQACGIGAGPLFAPGAVPLPSEAVSEGER